MWDWCLQNSPAANVATAGPYRQAREFSPRLLLVEAAQPTVRSDPDWRQEFMVPIASPTCNLSACA
jgi:hypothetical protein